LFRAQKTAFSSFEVIYQANVRDCHADHKGATSGFMGEVDVHLWTLLMGSPRESRLNAAILPDGER
jgi:hypothetical protein